MPLYFPCVSFDQVLHLHFIFEFWTKIPVFLKRRVWGNNFIFGFLFGGTAVTSAYLTLFSNGNTLYTIVVMID